MAPCYVTNSELRYVHVEPSALDRGDAGVGAQKERHNKSRLLMAMEMMKYFFVVLRYVFLFHFKRSTTTGSIIKHLHFSLYQNINMTILWVPNHETSSFFVEMTMSGSF